MVVGEVGEACADDDEKAVRMSDLVDGVLAVRDALPAYEKAESYYYNRVAQTYLSSRLAASMRGLSDEYKVGLIKRVVDAVLNRLIIRDEGMAPDLKSIWVENELDLESGYLLRDALVYGDAYLVVWPGDEDENGRPVSVEIFPNSPKTVRVFYQVENPRKKAYAVKAWPVATSQGVRTRANLYYADHVEKWITVAQEWGEKDSDWVHWFDDESDAGSWSYENPYGEVPVFHLRTARPYGRPEHEDAYGAQNALNKLLSTLMAVIEAHGAPHRWFALDPDGSVSNGVPGLEDATPDPSDVPLNERVPSTPGAVDIFRGKVSAGQFEPAEVKNFLESMAAVVRLMAVSTATPGWNFDPVGALPSGETLKVAEAPLVKRVKDRQRAFGGAIEDALSFALRVSGAGRQTVVLEWEPAEPSIDLAPNVIAA